jgi:CubicO group peptidase (beta-lactamase class C family)
LSRNALTELRTKSGETPPNQDDYGLATFIEAGDGHVLTGHTGGIGGSATYAYFLEPEGVAVVMMANRMPVDFRKASQHVFRVLVKQ